jgi:hydrogenase maturation protein HypF
MTRRLAIRVHGVVQGVGFRPFVYRAACEQGLAGWVSNGVDGVRIEVQGAPGALESFLETLRHQAPPQAAVDGAEVHEIEPVDGAEFTILESALGSTPRPAIPADLGTCAECLAEVRDPVSRRYGYAFTNCTHCGPRWTILEHLPYDRPNTSMRGFPLCADCEREYSDPADRRFHAQPIACPACGPQLALQDAEGRLVAAREAAIDAAARALCAGQIVAMQGLGGFQLLVDATDGTAVARLRERKRRWAKPLALMLRGLDAARALCEVSEVEAAALLSPRAPILLLSRHADERGLAAEVAPGNPRLGIMLPYTPLHHLMMQAAGRPLVCTSGNVSGEPLCIDLPSAQRLGIADLFLAHDRPIVRPVDDSVARVDGDGLGVLRRARGWAPLPVQIRQAGPTVLAVGAHLKSTVALGVGSQVVLSQHLGDLDTPEGIALFERTIDDLLAFFETRPQLVACDLHPDYASTNHAERLANSWNVPLVRVQHHHAHVAACMAEHGLEDEVLGLAWDGTGYGADGTVWGGEFLACTPVGFRRVAHLRHFALPGGERAVKEPRRAALGILYELFGDGARERAREWFGEQELVPLLAMLRRGVNSPRTSSVGRLFDAVAALIGIRTLCDFEGQAAMELEFAMEGASMPLEGAYPFPLETQDGAPLSPTASEGAPLAVSSPWVADWEPLVRALLHDRDRGVPARILATRFHGALVDLAAAVALRAGLPRIVLAGGCFQNAYLLENVRARLRGAGFEVYTPRAVPPNDGGIALGQAFVAARRFGEVPHVPRHSG